MIDWGQIARTFAHELDERMDARRARDGSVIYQIVPYRSYGTSAKFQIRGRVLARPLIIEANGEGTLGALTASWRRFRSDEVTGARIRASRPDFSTEATTDGEGYFEITMSGAAVDPSEIWHPVQLQLLEPPSEEVSAAGVLVPPAAATRGIISDIDDTIVETGATSLLSMARNTMLGTAKTRIPFEGVARFYKDLAGAAPNPIFYVSSGPWNLYDLLTEFMDINEIPHGPLLLQDFGLDKDRWIHLPHQTHKLTQIDSILSTYPHLPFVLIGDSGQKDPEIYLDVLRKWRERIDVIYIRDVTTTRRDDEVHKIARMVEDEGGTMVLVATTAEAEADARKRGLIAEMAQP